MDQYGVCDFQKERLILVDVKTMCTIIMNIISSSEEMSKCRIHYLSDRTYTIR